MELQETARQDNRILQIYSIYRLTLPLILLLSHFISPITARIGSIDPERFLLLSSLYAVYALLVALVTVPGGTRPYQDRTLGTLFLIDILVIAALAYSSGGMVSGLGLLLLVSVATGAILMRGRPALLLPAVASLAILYSEAYLQWSGLLSNAQFMQAGLLGVLLFLISAYLQYLTQRMRSSVQLAREQASNIEELEQINQRIIQRMRTGIVLVDADHRILMYNDSARELLKLRTQNTDHAPALPIGLQALLLAWLEEPSRQPEPQKLTPSGAQLSIKFAFLQQNQTSPVLVFIEDHSRIIQRARQMKLGSLGHLTAGIAHEIRNPLGAIGHATQLLAESGQLDENDRQLLEMVLNNSRRINLIIEDVLQLSRQSEQPPETIMLKPWLEKLIAQYQVTHQIDDGFSLQISPADCRIRFVSSQLEQVMGNLIDNGLRYSRQATGEHRLTIRGGQRAPNTPVRLSIIDEGPGVPNHELDRLFEPFHTTEAQGTGLGLYISRQLCEANHARLSYSRTRDGKSRFIIDFAHPGRDIS